MINYGRSEQNPNSAQFQENVSLINAANASLSVNHLQTVQAHETAREAEKQRQAREALQRRLALLGSTILLGKMGHSVGKKYGYTVPGTILGASIPIYVVGSVLHGLNGCPEGYNSIMCGVVESINILFGTKLGRAKIQPQAIDPGMNMSITPESMPFITR